LKFLSERSFVIYFPLDLATSSVQTALAGREVARVSWGLRPLRRARIERFSAGGNQKCRTVR
jgi:hypothetical protein